VLAWPLFMLGLLGLGVRDVRVYAAWLLGAGVSAWPYVITALAGQSTSLVAEMSAPAAAIGYILGYITHATGWVFFHNVGAFPRDVVGSIGLLMAALGGMLAVGLWIVGGPRHPAARRATLATLVLLLGLLTMVQVGAFRPPPEGPWYTTFFAPLWVGLACLAAALWRAGEAIPPPRSHLGSTASLAVRLWSLAVMAGLAGLLLTSRGYDEDWTFVVTRSPVAASCLRNWRSAASASVECRELAADWPTVLGEDYFRRMGEPLERHGLSVFAPRQRWLLQGDFVLPTVQVEESAGAPESFWSLDRTLEGRSPPGDYRHLNLMLHTPNSVLWTVHLPDNLERAELRSAAALGLPQRGSIPEEGLALAVVLQQAGRPDILLYADSLPGGSRRWHPFRLSLSGYAGRTVTLRFTAQPAPGSGGGWLALQGPALYVTVSPGPPG
jgi:hypothetical protein